MSLAPVEKSAARSARNTGARNPNARLSADDVAAIRSRVEAGERYRDLAAVYAVDATHISLIVRGKRWAP